MNIDYKPDLDERLKTQVLILATVHLRNYGDRFQPSVLQPPSVLEPILSVLKKFNPDLIGVEDIPPSVLEDMERKDGIFAETIEEMGKIRVAESNTIEFGHIAQTLMNVSRQEAEAAADALLQTNVSLDSHKRLEAVAYLLAAYDYNSALLQWSYLPESVHNQNGLLPQKVTARFNQDLQAPHESVSIGITLARMLQHQRIASIDDQTDVSIFAKIPLRFFEALSAHPEYKTVLKSKPYQESIKRAKRAFQSGTEMFNWYLYLNSPQFASGDVEAQWGMYFRTELLFGRSRVAQWEVRNLRIASHIREAMALFSGKRMLVIIGCAHKPFLEAYLSQMLDLKLIQLNDL